WRGLPLFKTAFDFAIYPQLLQELRPRTILEIGSGSGASALWLADLAPTLGLDAVVHSVDIPPATAEHAGVRFYRGDCRDPPPPPGPCVPPRCWRRRARGSWSRTRTRTCRACSPGCTRGWPPATIWWSRTAT